MNSAGVIQRFEIIAIRLICKALVRHRQIPGGYQNPGVKFHHAMPLKNTHGRQSNDILRGAQDVAPIQPARFVLTDLPVFC